MLSFCISSSFYKDCIAKVLVQPWNCPLIVSRSYTRFADGFATDALTPAGNWGPLAYEPALTPEFQGLVNACQASLLVP